MSRHSKNNTASSVFTYHERQQLNYGSKKNRLGADSLRNFDACFLCLQTARDPLCCPKGHLSCKECIYENIISQKKKMARQQKETESILALREAVTEEKETAAQQSLLEEFERSQTHFLPMSRLSKHEKEEADGEAKTPDEKDGKDYNLVDTSSGKVFQIDVDEMAARAKQERDRAMAILEKEEAEKNKPKLPSFWIPSLTPAAMPAVLPVIKKETECTASKHPHPITIKKLIPVKFATAESSKKSTNGNIVPSEKICPSCTKTIMNSTKLAISKSCGHVLCKSCVEKFTVKSGRCFVCNAKCREKDLIEMTGEGTGFSAGGKAEAVREDVAFQC